jgi:hypothetical protein
VIEINCLRLTKQRPESCDLLEFLPQDFDFSVVKEHPGLTKFTNKGFPIFWAIFRIYTDKFSKGI